MHLRQLWLTNFRSYSSIHVELPAGLCAVLGPNGVGKSNLLEAVNYAATLASFRGAPQDALVKADEPSAVVRAEVGTADREHLIELEINRVGRNRAQLDRQRLQRASDLYDALRVTVFAPDDLDLLKGGPQVRRTYLDQSIVAERPITDGVRTDFERALKQRNALLKQCRGHLDDAAAVTLDVWDSKFAAVGEQLVDLRSDFAHRLSPLITQAYTDVATERADVQLVYQRSWSPGSLLESMTAARSDDLRRGVTTVGPHRDDLLVMLNGLPSRTHASQGEQRSLALAMRLGVHRLITDRIGVPPVLLLDDVFSELDPDRSAALLQSLPAGQTLLSSAVGLPTGLGADLIVDVTPGELTVRTSS
ncbi:MAG: DNA replication/repair protein RecF [Actinomycetes bacterium]